MNLYEVQQHEECCDGDGPWSCLVAAPTPSRATALYRREFPDDHLPPYVEEVDLDAPDLYEVDLDGGDRQTRPMREWTAYAGGREIVIGIICGRYDAEPRAAPPPPPPPSPEELARAAALADARNRRDTAERLAAGLLRHVDPDVRAAAVRALSRCADGVVGQPEDGDTVVAGEDAFAACEHGPRNATAGDRGVAIATYSGTATAGAGGFAISDRGGTAIAGAGGVAIVGPRGKASAGAGGRIVFARDPKDSMYGSDGTAYAIDEAGLVPGALYTLGGNCGNRRPVRV